MDEYTIVTKINIFSYFFSKTMEHYKITGKKLSQVSGVSENHISEFRRGKRKTGVSTDILWQLLKGMEKIAPGAKIYFASLMAGVEDIKELEENIKTNEATENFNATQMAVMINDNIDLITKAIPYLPSDDQAEIMSALAQAKRQRNLNTNNNLVNLAVVSA